MLNFIYLSLKEKGKKGKCAVEVMVEEKKPLGMELLIHMKSRRIHATGFLYIVFFRFGTYDFY